jgi:hypothetical protein
MSGSGAGESTANDLGRQQQSVPRWPAVVAVLLVGGAYLFISEHLTVGPPWLLLLALVVLLVTLEVFTLQGQRILPHGLGLVAVAVATIAVGGTTISLGAELLQTGLRGEPLLAASATIWVSNVLTFAVWYWEIDGGGPLARTGSERYSSDFLFPQQAQDGRASGERWAPNFVDYLFLAFNASTSFSPTDTPPLSRRAKILMMAQATISLIDVVVLLSRAISVLR